jgi:hypothetical protein
MRHSTTPLGHTVRAMRAGLASAVLTTTTLVGCKPSAQAVADGEDPLAALRSSAPSTRYTNGYWKEQGRAAAGGANVPAQRRWAEALAYCGEAQPRPGLEADGARPNCAAVRYALFELNTERDARETRARIDAAEARRRGMTPQQRRAALDSVLFKP